MNRWRHMSQLFPYTTLFRSGRELDAFERKMERLRESGNQQRLGQSRHSDQQRMAAGQDSDQHLIDHLLLADNHLGDLLPDFRSEEHTSELQSRRDLVCRLLL